MKCPQCGSENVSIERRPDGNCDCLSCRHHWKNVAPPPATPTPTRGSFDKPSHGMLQNRFRHHSPVGSQGQMYDQVRESILETAILCVAITPCSPEQTRAINALDEAMFLFNAAIARNPSDLVGTGPVDRKAVVNQAMREALDKCNSVTGRDPDHAQALILFGEAQRLFNSSVANIPNVV